MFIATFCQLNDNLVVSVEENQFLKVSDSHFSLLHLGALLLMRGLAAFSVVIVGVVVAPVAAVVVPAAVAVVAKLKTIAI